MRYANIVESDMLDLLGIEEKHHKLFKSLNGEDNVVGLELYSHRADFDLIKCYVIDCSSALYAIEEYHNWWDKGGYNVRKKLKDKFGYEC